MSWASRARRDRLRRRDRIDAPQRGQQICDLLRMGSARAPSRVDRLAGRRFGQEKRRRLPQLLRLRSLRQKPQQLGASGEALRRRARDEAFHERDAPLFRRLRQGLENHRRVARRDAARRQHAFDDGLDPGDVAEAPERFEQARRGTGLMGRIRKPAGSDEARRDRIGERFGSLAILVAPGPFDAAFEVSQSVWNVGPGERRGKRLARPQHQRGAARR